ncbi:transposase, IS605 family [Coleofasciculus chthonoplastes PCC 7420]|uniref:Transposase, IS605 family n=1 Tax=Coleofasciculus chthonoplastes PCC 7420 TaxID=118168 RepID=B4VWK4_9CYAN|nr:RNA-guided endonuclease TnpB family protein [Coleofasciculus chthonoplastes]EDX73713.1 transposase, IS605 family [Coleofasciculus chthonoplastes PCC 7420]
MILNHTYRLYPDNQQAQLLNEWLETLRVSYNYALRELKDWIASRKCPMDRCSLESEYIMSADYPFPSYHQQQNNLPKAKKEFPRLKSVPSQVLQTNIRRLHDAWDFFRERGYGFPRFKKVGQMKSMLFPQFKTNPVTGWHIQLPKLGKVEINLHRPIPDGFVVRQVRVVKKAMGWFAVITLYSDLEIPDPSPHGHAIGVDVGLLSYLATSDGFVEPGRKFFKTEQRRLKVLQRRLAKKKKRSKNYEKARKKVELQHNHIALKRKDYQYKLAHKLCDMADTIFVEDIDFRIMAKGFLGKQTIDAGFGQFRSILKLVGKKRGVFVGEVDCRGTSQTCPNCRITVRKELSERIHSCPECKYEVDRDIASAQEICNRGIETYPGTLEKQEIGSQVEVSGAMCLDNWRRGAMPNREVGKPTA